MKVVATGLALIAVSAIVMLEANIKGSITLWGTVFRTVGWIAIVGMLILIYERTGSRRVVYSSVLILAVLGLFMIFLGILALIASLYLFSLVMVLIGGAWVWFIMNRYREIREVIE
jgi:hypothetical protein